MIGVLRILGILCLFGLDWVYEKLKSFYVWILFFLIFTSFLSTIKE